MAAICCAVAILINVILRHALAIVLEVVVRHVVVVRRAVAIVIVTSEVEPKTLFMGHEISSFHAPVGSSFLYCSRLGYHLEVFVFFTL